MSGYAGKAATQFFILWAFARTAGSAGAGEFAFAMAVCSPVFVLAELALRNVFQTLANPPSFRSFFVIRVACAGAAAFAIAAAASVIDGFPALVVLVPLLVMRTADSALDICWGGLLAVGRVGATAGWMWLNTALTLVAVAAVVAWESEPEWAITGSALASVAVLGVVATRLLATGKEGWLPSRGDARRVLRAGGALGIGQGLDTLLLYLPTLFLAAAARPEDVGVLAVCLYLLTFANLFFSSVIQTSLVPMRAALESGSVEALHRLGRRIGIQLMALGFAGGVAALIVFPTAASTLFGPEFQVSRKVVLPIVLAVLALSIEYATTPTQLVLNRYGSRVRATGLGIAAAALVAVVTWDDASLMAAGWVLVAGMVARAASSTWTLRLALADSRRPQLDLERI